MQLIAKATPKERCSNTSYGGSRIKAHGLRHLKRVRSDLWEICNWWSIRFDMIVFSSAESGELGKRYRWERLPIRLDASSAHLSFRSAPLSSLYMNCRTQALKIARKVLSMVIHSHICTSHALYSLRSKEQRVIFLVDTVDPF